MIRIALAVAAICTLGLGVWELVLAFQWPGKDPSWKVTVGWIADEGGEYTFQLPGRRAQAVDFLIKDQQISYVFFVNDAMYFKRLELPFNIAPVRTAFHKPFSVSDLEHYVPPNDHLPSARFNPKTKKLEVLTDPGMTISFNAITTHSGVKWEAVGREAWDNYMSRIKVKYNPSNPDESITDPDLLNGASTLLWSGIIFIGISLFLVGGMIFHAWATKEEELPDPFQPQSQRI